jgi:two-component system, NtrC family, response regulator HydG
LSVSIAIPFADRVARLDAAHGGQAPANEMLPPGVSEFAEQLRRVIPQTTTLLLTGETGTGKSRLARRIHDLSPRRAEPFLVVDCGVLAPQLIESEMFGHVKGAFTGAEADRPGKFTAAGQGTLLLDEINTLPLCLQSKLLRAVDDRMFDPVGADVSEPLQARIIAVSSVPLDEEIAAGRFRADLYYRLNVVTFHLRPLRERREAIVPLAHRFLADCAARNRPQLQGISMDALELLQAYDWPGNIRELHNVIERAVALAPGTEVEASDLPQSVREARASVPTATTLGDDSATVPDWLAGPDNLNLSQGREQVEIFRIAEALRKHRNNRLRAAAELGISRMSLYKKLHKYGLINPTAERPTGTA